MYDIYKNEPINLWVIKFVNFKQTFVNFKQTFVNFKQLLTKVYYSTVQSHVFMSYLFLMSFKNIIKVIHWRLKWETK